MAAALVLGLTALGPNNRAVLLEGIVIPHEGGAAIEPGRQVEINIQHLSKLAAPADLDIWAENGGGLRLMPGTATPVKVEPDRVRFFLHGPAPDRLSLANYGKAPVTPGRIRVRNYIVRNTGIPRFAVLIPGSAHKGTDWTIKQLTVLIGGALFMLLLGSAPWLARGGRFDDPRFWTLVALPSAGLVLVAAIAAAGYRLLLAFDAYLLLCGLGPALVLLFSVKSVARWVDKSLGELYRAMARTRAWQAVAAVRLPGYVMLVLVLAIIFVPAVILPSPPAKVPFNNDWLTELNKKEPYVVAIGNSMVGSRIDVKRFSELLGKPVDMNWVPGTGPRLWYMLFKNYVCQSQNKPKYVLLLIGDYEFVWPRKGWKNEWDIRQIESMTPDKYRYDPEFAEICLKDPTFRQRLQYHFREWFNVSNYAFPAKEWLAELVMAITVPPEWVKRTERQYQAVFWRNYINERFALDRLRAGVFVPRPRVPDEAYNHILPAFEKGFFPRFVRLAKENGIQLIVVRLQHRRFNAVYKKPEPERMRNAVEEQAKYFKEHGIPFHDFTGDPKITEDLYGVGDHIGFDQRRTRWTEIMFERIGGWFK